jgi:hypothetical protein
MNGSRVADLKALALIVVAWTTTVLVGLWITRSKLPQDLRPRRRATQVNPRPPAAPQEQLQSGMEP